MDIGEIAGILSEKMKQEHDFEKCLRFALSFSEGLNIVYGIDEAELIEALTLKDSRFKNGYAKKHILIPNSKLNPSGAVYVSKNDLTEAREAGDFAIFTIRGKGL